MTKQTRRDFLKSVGAVVASTTAVTELGVPLLAKSGSTQPNIVFVFADQWRAQAAGHSGDPNVRTPNLDRLCRESVNFSNALSTCPVCSPYRASLMTGQCPLTHGVFVNDVPIGDRSVTIAEVLVKAGYDTGYIGKWHIDGHGRSAFIPKERRRGFQYWKAMECTHNYNNSHYYGATPEMLKWDGYDAKAQTRDAVEYIRSHKTAEKPFALFLSWGPPHNPYQTAPEEYKRMYDPAKLILRPNVPEEMREAARKDLVGYYAHITALDSCFGRIMDAVEAAGLKEDTIVVFTSDHGDMLGSQGKQRKQKPWDESIRVPFLLRYPGRLGGRSKEVRRPIGTPDIMPTLLGLCGLSKPAGLEGTDFTDALCGRSEAQTGSALIACYDPFGEWARRNGGKEYRGIRTERYTYARDLKGPWLLYDNKTDPYQMKNLCSDPRHRKLQADLDRQLIQKLKKLGDEFLPGSDYVRQWDYGSSYLQ